MCRRRVTLCAVMAIVIPSRAWTQESSAVASAMPDSSSCVAWEGRRDAAPAPVPPDSVRPPSSGTAPTRTAAIILRASASAREVRFASQPRIQVRLCGGVLDSVRVLERRNLPDPVQPGATYRDVFIAVEILGHLDAECLASRITGAGSTAGPCAALQIRDTSGAVRRTPP